MRADNILVGGKDIGLCSGGKILIKINFIETMLFNFK